MKDTKTRQLAAIMFADIVGYTALMQGDEKVAAKARSRHREVFQKLHAQYHGEIIQYYGDGALSVFRSAIEAVRCAVEIQKLLQQGDPVSVRIGLHMGDIVYSDTEVYGDGVNFASRIESMGIGGGVLISDKLNEELKNHKDISTKSLGRFVLKNISRPVEVFAVTNEGMVIPRPEEMKGKQTRINKTIAVLPFVNMSTSEENEYFSDGITEEIITALSKIKSLKVTSRTSSFFFKNKKIPIKQIAEELNVSTILEGSVRLSGGTLRITAQLIQAHEDFHFWSESWDRKLEKIFEIQDEISLLIAEKLREHLGHFEIQDHLVEKQTDSIDAYEYSLKAIFHFRKWNPSDIRIAISLYEKAIELDPGHTESYLGLADSYGFLATTGFMSAGEAWSKAIEFTEKAAQLNDRLPGVYYHQANLSFFTACNYSESLAQVKRAIELQPNYAEARQFLAFLYILAGKKNASKEQLNIAQIIDPLSPEVLFYSGYNEYMLGEYEKCLVTMDQCLEQNSKNIPAHTIKRYCLLKMERFDEVLKYYDDVPDDILVAGDKEGLTGLAYALKGDAANAEKCMNQLLEQAKTPDGFNASSYLFMIYAATEQYDKAFQWVDQAIKDHSSLLLIRFADPIVQALKVDSRYEEYQNILFPPGLFTDEQTKKKALLDDKSVVLFTDKLLDHIRDAEPFLDPNLSLRSLAEQIDIHPNQLSWLINESLGQNFNEFINHYRVETFIRIAQDPHNAHLTLVALAYDSGFNSKTVFNNFFKKETGLTPRQYLKLRE
jgi:TolB-like protein/AraC-like DNA-binding protein